MKLINAVFIGGLVVFGLAANDSAMADRGGGHGGVGVGLAVGLGLGLGYPYYGPGYYYPRYYPGTYYTPPPYYYAPPTVTYYAPAPSYVMQGGNAPQAAPEQAPGSWYYCASAKAYYPYINQCPEDWQKVSPQPPPPAPR